MADYKSTHTGAEIDAGIDKAVTAETNWKLLMANLGIGRWANQTLTGTWGDGVIIDNLIPYYTNMNRYCANATFKNNGSNIILDLKNKTLNSNTLMFWNFNCAQANKNVVLKNATLSNLYHLTGGSNIASMLAENVFLTGQPYNIFAYSTNLQVIGEFDMSGVTSFLAEGSRICLGSPKIKSIKCKHWRISFDITDSTAFEEADLVEIISNLDTVTTAQTLTMGATNLAKLTDEEKKVATDKGWVLA